MQRQTRIIFALFAGAFAAGSLQASTYNQMILADNPIGYWQFNETSGSSAADSSTNANTATYNSVGLGAQSASLRLGTAGAFNGSSSNVRIPDIAAYDMGTGAFSVEFWYQTNSDSRGDLFTYKGTGGDFGIHSNSQGDPAGFNSSVSVYHGAFITQGGAERPLWHHVVYTRAGTGANQATLYVDGIAASVGTDTQTMNIVNDILIGSNHNGSPSSPNTFLNGTIDEVAIYNKALSADAVRAHFLSALGTSIGINFGSDQQALAASDVAGHVSVEQANWNNAAGASGSVANLVSNLNVNTGAAVSWSGSTNTFAIGGTATNGDQKMMKGYLDTSSSSTTSVTVSNIAFHNYDVYVYFDGSNGNEWRKGTYTIAGFGTQDGEDSENRDFITDVNDNAFQLPVPTGTGNLAYAERIDYWNTAGNNDEGNFLVFHNVTGSSFTLTALAGAHGNTNGNAGRAPINGIQIVGVVPTPAALPAGLALIGLLALRRDR
ncbi:MAG: hypothetical protein GC162_19215 [Planctomycetes bacterium]|nr:hypothetical protein [Planctomycetota bacterium]